jgi:hypothetical protein
MYISDMLVITEQVSINMKAKHFNLYCVGKGDSHPSTTGLLAGLTSMVDGLAVC